MKNIGLLEVHLSSPDDVDDDDEDEHDYEQMHEEFAQKKKRLQLVNQNLCKIERDLLRFSPYGEVRSILPKTNESSGKHLRDYEFMKEICGRFVNVKLYKNQNILLF